jgi:hypothetical protein
VEHGRTGLFYTDTLSAVDEILRCFSANNEAGEDPDSDSLESIARRGIEEVLVRNSKDLYRSKLLDLSDSNLS